MKRMVLMCMVVLLCSYAGQAQDNTLSGNQAPQNETVQKIKVFPNPATNVINILGLKNSLRADIVISDIYGNTLLKYQWQIKTNALNIPVASLNAGIYMVTIISQEQKVQTKFYKK
ncbi:T9SS type A sorting domain-containing protein [Maribacter polysiphoniae]|uniref:T9SS type A sorting domain-containing protein n=2 Tax=Maribacter polysiphoniae TaxID=429344 RepID=A0ABR7VUE7_9FLAO|nr:T9SS type A sorting domain-containing protein [Maribacter polysiphoniae]MBD1259619.1 T9SS type A sorting domain-containing protein [Maribacter polysiphoniae]